MFPRCSVMDNNSIVVTGPFPTANSLRSRRFFIRNLEVVA